MGAGRRSVGEDQGRHEVRCARPPTVQGAVAAQPPEVALSPAASNSVKNLKPKLIGAGVLKRVVKGAMPSRPPGR